MKNGQASAKESSEMDNTLNIELNRAGCVSADEPENKRLRQDSLLSAISGAFRFTPDAGVSTRRGSSHDLNQDCGLAPVPGFPVIAVADGISRSNRGEVASRLALMPFAMSRITGCNDLEQLAFAANDFVKRCYELFDAGRPGQTTLVAARVRRLVVAEYISIGDSRAYMLVPHGFLKRKYRCKQITTDQTHGERKKRVAYNQPDKYRDDVMVHAIGAGLVLEEIETGTVSIPSNGMLLLATDGFFKGMGDEHCRQIALLADKHCGLGMQKLADALVSEAAENFDTGDDITVAVISPAYLAGARWPFWGATMAAFLTFILTAL